MFRLTFLDAAKPFCPKPTLRAMSGGNPLETELNTYRTIQSEISKVQGNISTAQTQILENELVLKVCGAAEPTPQTLRAHTLTRAFAAALRSSIFWRTMRASSS